MDRRAGARDSFSQPGELGASRRNVSIAGQSRAAKDGPVYVLTFVFLPCNRGEDGQ